MAGTEHRITEKRRRREQQGHAARLARGENPGVFVGLLGRLVKPDQAPTPHRSAASATDKRQALRRRVSSPRNTATSVRAAPPVMTRNPLIGAAVNRVNPTRRPARRVDVPLRGVPGAEMRLPALPRLQNLTRLFSLLLAAGLAFLLYFMWTAPFFQIQEATINGLQRINPRDVEIVLDAAHQPVFSLNPWRMQSDLQAAFPEFESVSVSVGLPAGLFVDVVERTPVLVWRQDGRSDLVDSLGVAFPLRPNMPVENLPAVEAASAPPGQLPSAEELLKLISSEPADDEQAASPSQPASLLSGSRQLLAKEMVAAVLAMAREAPKDTPLVYQAQHGLGWKDRRGWDVYFGTAEQMEMKLRIYDAIVKHIKQEDIKPEMVSVEYVHAPYYRLER